MKVLVLRTCEADMSAHGGFVWPASGPVEAPDWSPKEVCGFGLHGFLWGEGDGSLASWADDAKWLVVEVDEKTIVSLNGKVKFPRGEVVFCGKQDDAIAYLSARAPAGKAIIGQSVSAGHKGTATAGYKGTATAGHSGTATAGAGGTATAGDKGTATAGYGGTATAGYGGTATAGDYGNATAGYGGNATAGYGGNATAGDDGNATAGHKGTATAGAGGTATAGDGGTATAGYGGTATAGHKGTATAGYGGTATAGVGGTISIRYWDSRKEKYRLAVAEVGEDGIEANTAYILDDDHIFVKKVK
jgi:hypothetical protein